MKINVGNVVEQIDMENAMLKPNMGNISSLMDGMQRMVDSAWLEGKTYGSMKEYYSDIVIPLTQSLFYLLEYKVDANEQYKSLLSIYFGDTSKYDMEKIIAYQTQIRKTREYLQNLSSVLMSYNSICVLLYQLELRLQEKIDKGEQFISVSQGVYDEVNGMKQIFSQGLTSMRTAICNDMGQCVNIKNINKTWVDELNIMLGKRYSEMAQEEYKDYLEEHPEDIDKVIKIIEFETMHSSDVNKINDFLSPLKEKTAIEVKYAAYTAREPYRSLWIKYLDQYKIVDASYEGKAKFNPKDNGIFIDESLINDNKEEFMFKFFHECGHAIDSNARNDKQNLNGYFSDTYKYNELKTLDECNASDVRNNLYKMIDIIYDSSLNEGKTIEEELKEEESYENWSDEKKDKIKEETVKHLLLENQEKPSEEVRGLKVKVREKYSEQFGGSDGKCVSDIYEAHTDWYIGGCSSHYEKDNPSFWWVEDDNTGKKYRNRTSNSECFAEYFQINMMNDTAAIETTKKYLPESYSCMDEMIKEME